MRQHLSGTVLPLTELNPALPSTLDRVIRKALQRQPGARYQTAEAFQHALLNYLEAGLAVQEEPQLNRLLGGHPQVRQRLLYALFLFAILGGIVLVGVLLQLARVAR